jgi:predicted alpha/beta hydrolase family esterase
MPDEDDPNYARCSVAVRREMAGLEEGAVVVGHSVGGAILINALAEQLPERELAAIVLVAAPFVGAGGWPGDEFELPGDLSAASRSHRDLHRPDQMRAHRHDRTLAAGRPRVEAEAIA